LKAQDLVHQVLLENDQKMDAILEDRDGLQARLDELLLVLQEKNSAEDRVMDQLQSQIVEWRVLLFS
jgi:hypothetical protein